MPQITPEQMREADERFLKTAYSGNELHVRASQYALEQVSDPEIRALAEHLIRDHEQAGKATAQVANAEDVHLADELLSDRPKLLPPHKAMLESAMEVKGDAFASVYLFNMASLHVHDILDFSHEATHSPSAAIRAFASQTLPTLQEHYAQIKPLAARKAGLTSGL